MLGVAVRRVGARQHIGLLRARGHAGGGAAALYVDQHHGDFREVGEADEFVHQRNAGAGGGGERTRAVPARTDGDAHRGEFVFALNDGVARLAGFRLFAQLLAIADERFSERRRRRNRVPRAYAGTAVHRAQGRRAVAVDKDFVADIVGAFDLDAQRALQMLQRVLTAEFQRLEVGLQQRFFALVLLGKEFFDFRWVHVEQGRQRADINNVLEQLALTRIGIRFVADFGERHADDVNVVAELRLRHRLGAVVKQIAADVDFLDVFVPGLRVHRDHHVHAAAPAEITGFGDAHFVPRGQALNIRGENITRRNWHAHTQNRACEKLVR